MMAAGRPLVTEVSEAFNAKRNHIRVAYFQWRHFSGIMKIFSHLRNLNGIQE
jgi:hypothetical protein